MLLGCVHSPLQTVEFALFIGHRRMGSIILYVQESSHLRLPLTISGYICDHSKSHIEEQ